MTSVRHFACTILKKKDDDDDVSKHHNKVSEIVISMLNDTNCNTGSIVYVVVKGVLIFDRHRNGLVVTPKVEQWLLYGSQGSKRRSISIGQEPSGTSPLNRNSGSLRSVEEYHQHLVTSLPAPVLEYLIMFLEDETAGTLPLVCKSWYQEVGRKSPDLWKQLCNRNRWPVHGNFGGVDQYRENYVSHYNAVRTFRSLAKALRNVSESKTLECQREIAVMQGVGLGEVAKPWSECRILVATDDEISLDLYEAVDSSQKDACHRLRRVVHQFIPSQSQRRCPIQHLDLDDECVVCISVDSLHDQRYLHYFRRSSLLECAGSKSPHELKQNDVSTFTLDCLIEDYIHESNHAETGVRIGGQLVRVECVDNCHACGNGLLLLVVRLLVEVETATSLSSNEEEEQENEGPWVKKLFLFSAISGCIVWSNDMLPLGGVRLLGATGFWRQNHPTEGDSVFAVCCHSSSQIQTLKVQSSGTVLLDTERRVQLAKSSSEEDFSVIVGEHETIAVQFKEGKTVLSFAGPCEYIDIPGTLITSTVYNGTYVLLALAFREEEGDDDVSLDLNLKLFHIPSRVVVSECQAGKSRIEFSSDGSSIIVLTEDERACLLVNANIGNELRQKSLSLSSKDQEKTTRRKKKTSKRKSNSGVDGFARGMRMN
ncbi:MAG: hypothetical protein SGILL_002028 [Bacillariaceae sp.]